MTFPAWLYSKIGGATLQQVPTFRSAALKLFSTVSGRWMVHTLSWASTATPIVEPVTQWFGSGLGQNGSTSNLGAIKPAAWTTGRLCTAQIVPRTATSPKTPARTQIIRFIAHLTQTALRSISGADHTTIAPSSGSLNLTSLN